MVCSNKTFSLEFCLPPDEEAIKRFAAPPKKKGFDINISIQMRLIHTNNCLSITSSSSIASNQRKEAGFLYYKQETSSSRCTGNFLYKFDDIEPW